MSSISTERLGVLAGVVADTEACVLAARVVTTKSGRAAAGTLDLEVVQLTMKLTRLLQKHCGLHYCSGSLFSYRLFLSGRRCCRRHRCPCFLGVNACGIVRC